jgi:hypothetical protein
VATLVAAAALVLAGCGSGGDAEPASAPRSDTPAASSRTYTVEELAAAVGCKPELAGKAKDLRQASCTSGGDNFVFLQFDKLAGEEDWLEYATAYGGTYLAGDRWVLSGRSEEYLRELQKELGGEIRKSGS